MLGGPVALDDKSALAPVTTAEVQEEAVEAATEVP